MNGGASGCASERVLLSQFLDTDHRTPRLANDRVRIGAQTPNQAAVGAPADDQNVRSQLFRLGADSTWHIAGDDQPFSLRSDTLLEPVQLTFGAASQVLAPSRLVVIFLSR